MKKDTLKTIICTSAGVISAYAVASAIKFLIKKNRLKKDLNAKMEFDANEDAIMKTHDELDELCTPWGFWTVLFKKSKTR